jgi:hypothetical protein
VTKWEYCKIIEPIKLMGKPTEAPKLMYLGGSKEEEKVQEIDTPEHALARLGGEGWELVDHTQLFTVIESNVTLPVMEVYHLKRAMTEAV